MRADGVLGMVPVREEKAFAAVGDTYPHAELERCPPPPTDEYIVVRSKSGEGGERLLEAVSGHKVSTWTSKAVLKQSGVQGGDAYYRNVRSDTSRSSRLQLFLCVLLQLTFSLVVCGAWFGTTGFFDGLKGTLGAPSQVVAAPPPPPQTCEAPALRRLCPYAHLPHSQRSGVRAPPRPRPCYSSACSCPSMRALL